MWFFFKVKPFAIALTWNSFVMMAQNVFQWYRLVTKSMTVKIKVMNLIKSAVSRKF